MSASENSVRLPMHMHRPGSGNCFPAFDQQGAAILLSTAVAYDVKGPLAEWVTPFTKTIHFIQLLEGVEGAFKNWIIPL